ncbi:acyltransferase family protein, partial [Silvibacterium sp.]|uniref:acyltransferase family protein n=1 Tax=Silvibacterium sp. TaxID=1964179 RepID=UPI0039E2E583
IQFYLLAPLFMQVFRIQSALARRLLLVSAVGACGLLQWHVTQTGLLHLTLLYYVQYFLAGILIADICVRDLTRLRAGWSWDIVGLGALPVMFLIQGHDNLMHLLLPAVDTLLVLAGLRSLMLRRFLRFELIAIVGGACYSIYLLHFVLIAVLFKATKHFLHGAWGVPLNLLVQFFVLLLPVVFLCLLYYRFIERPCMDPNWLSRLAAKFRSIPAAEVESLSEV